MKKFTKEEVQQKLPKNCVILSDYKNSRTPCTFQCPDCSNAFITKPEHVFSGHTKSCGCLSTKRRTGIGELSGSFYSKLKTQAKHRNMDFPLSKEYLYSLLLLQDFKCALTGIPIEIGYKNGKDRNNINASLDRIDSSKGYIEGNVQWVHKDVNKMKNNINQNRFINLCKMIVENSLDNLD